MGEKANEKARERKARRDRWLVLCSGIRAEVREHVTVSSRVRFDRASIAIESSSFDRLAPTQASAQEPDPQKTKAAPPDERCAASKRTSENDEERS